MELQQLYIYTPPKYIEEWNRLYIEPIVKEAYKIDRSPLSINMLLTELNHINRANNKLAGSTAYYSAKVRKEKARNEYKQLAESLTYLNKFENSDLTLTALNFLIKPKNNSKKIALLDDDNGASYNTFVNKDADNALKALAKVRKRTNKLINNYYRNSSLNWLNREFKSYSIEQDIEYILAVHTTAKGKRKPQLHEHIHGLLIIPSKDIKQLTGMIRKELNQDYVIEFENVNSDYSDPKNHGSKAINLADMQDIKDYKALESVVTYNNKQTSLPLPNKRATSSTGERLNFSQSDLLNSLDDETKVKTILAMMNTEKGIRKRSKAGMINQLSKLKELIYLLKLIESQKNHSNMIELCRDESGRESQLETCPFDKKLGKPPP